MCVCVPLFDTNMILVPHVSAVCQSAPYHIGKSWGSLTRTLARNWSIPLWPRGWTRITVFLWDLSGTQSANCIWFRIWLHGVVRCTRVNEHITPCSHVLALAPCPAENSVRVRDPPPDLQGTARTRPQLHLWATAVLSTSTHFEASHGRTQIVRVQSCDIMRRVCPSAGLPLLCGRGFLSLADVLTPWTHSNLCSKPTLSNVLSLSILCKFESEGLFHRVTPSIALHSNTYSIRQ